MLEALDNLEKFFHAEKNLPTLLKAGMYMLNLKLFIHFFDGNGRMGRLLITFLLCHELVLKRPLLYLSHFFKANKLEYFEHLQRVRDEGDWETWLKFFLRGVCEVAAQATTTAQQIVQLRESHRNIISMNFPHSGSAYTLLEYLYDRPIITVKSAMKATGLSYANANKLVMKFEKYGILREMTHDQRNRRFSYDRYLMMFADLERGKKEGNRE